jgi:hypothetical protein
LEPRDTTLGGGEGVLASVKRAFELKGRIRVAAYTLLTPTTTATAAQRATCGARHLGVGTARFCRKRA